jgi:hypothetical protein
MSLSSFNMSDVDMTGYDPYGKGIPGLDTSAYSMDAIQSKPKKDFGFSDIVKLLGIGAGVAGDVISLSRDEAPKFSRMAGPRLAKYFTSNPNKTSDLFGFGANTEINPNDNRLFQAIVDTYSGYSRAANPFG